MKFIKEDLLKASFLQLFEKNLDQDKLNKVVKYLGEIDETGLKLFLMNKKQSLSESESKENIDILFEDYIDDYSLDSIITEGAFVKAAGNAVGIGMNVGLEYLIRKRGKCLKFCEGNKAIGWAALFGVASYHFYKAYIPTLKNIQRKACILKCKVQYHSIIDKSDPAKLIKWKQKLQDFIIYVKRKAEKSTDPKKKKALLSALQNGIASKSY